MEMDYNAKTMHVKNLAQIISAAMAGDRAQGQERGYLIYDRILRVCDLDDHADWLEKNREQRKT